MSGRIVMKLYDEDKINDEMVGSLLFNMKECINEKVIYYYMLMFIYLEWQILLEEYLWSTIRLFWR